MACVDKINQMKMFRRDLRIVDTLLIKSSFVGKPRPFLIQHIDKSECRGLRIRGRPRTKALQTEAIEWRWLFGSMEWRRNFYEQGITCFFMSDQRVKTKTTCNSNSLLRANMGVLRQRQRHFHRVSKLQNPSALSAIERMFGVPNP